MVSMLSVGPVEVVSPGTKNRSVSLHRLTSSLSHSARTFAIYHVAVSSPVSWMNGASLVSIVSVPPSGVNEI